MERYYLSVIVPAYNEGHAIHRSMETLFGELNKLSGEFEVIAVNDGSRDDTLEQLIKLKTGYKQLKVISYKTNKGKGHAIHRGMEMARGKYCAVIDADMEIHPAQILTYLERLESVTEDDKRIFGITGCKFDPESQVDFPMYRRLMSMCYYKFLHFLFTFDLKDTQTGLKIFKTEKIRSLLEMLQVDGFAYDVEMLAAIYDNGGRMMTAPVVCSYLRDDARINVKSVGKTFLDTMDIFINDLSGRYRED